MNSSLSFVFLYICVCVWKFLSSLRSNIMQMKEKVPESFYMYIPRVPYITSVGIREELHLNGRFRNLARFRLLSCFSVLLVSSSRGACLK